MTGSPYYTSRLRVRGVGFYFQKKVKDEEVSMWVD